MNSPYYFKNTKQQTTKNNQLKHEINNYSQLNRPFFFLRNKKSIIFFLIDSNNKKIVKYLVIQNESLNKAKTLSTIFHLPIPPPILFVYLFVCVFGFFGTMALRMCTSTDLTNKHKLRCDSFMLQKNPA